MVVPPAALLYPPAVIGGQHPVGAALKLPLPPGDVKSVKAAVKVAAAPPMGAPVPLEYAFDGLLQHVPAPGPLAQWCADAITGAGWLVAVSPGTITVVSTPIRGGLDDPRKRRGEL